MSFVSDRLNRILAGKKIFWIGGGYYLTIPSLRAVMSGAVTFFSEKKKIPEAHTDTTIDLESWYGYRPDWNRLTDSQTYEHELIEKFFASHKHVLDGSVLFPYYVSCFLEKLANRANIKVIGNPADTGEKIYLRNEGRHIAQDTGFLLPETKRFQINAVPDFKTTSAMCGSEKLVMTPAYSDGGAWVHIVKSEADFQSAMVDLSKFEDDDYIEITPFYDGIPMNLNICNLPVDSRTGCTVHVYMPSVQIIGDPNLSDEKLRYCGCDFALSGKILDGMDTDLLYQAAVNIGQNMFSAHRWCGFFGVDFILRPDNSLVFLEINPRLQSSTHMLDIQIRDEWNPMLMQTGSFLKKDLGKERPLSNFIGRKKVTGAMLVAYNNTNKWLYRYDTRKTLSSSFDFPEKGQHLAPGAVMFRCLYGRSVIDSSTNVLKKDICQEILDQKKAGFMYSDSI